MKKLLIYFCFLGIVSLVFACGPKSDNSWGHGFGMGYAGGSYDDRDNMIRDLGISNDQADRIAAIDAKYRELYFKNRGAYKKISELRGEHKEAIDEVLNDRQIDRLDRKYYLYWGDWGREYSRHAADGYYGKGYGLGYCSGLYSSEEYMKKDLKLSDEQAKKIADIDSRFRDLYKQNKKNYSKIDELRIEHKKAIEDVLSPEQKKKFTDTYNSRWRARCGSRLMGPGMMGYVR